MYKSLFLFTGVDSLPEETKMNEYLELSTSIKTDRPMIHCWFKTGWTFNRKLTWEED